jgi:hypothetical protein
MILWVSTACYKDRFTYCRYRHDQVKEDEMGMACSTNGEKRNAYRILVGKLEGKMMIIIFWDTDIHTDSARF